MSDDFESLELAFDSLKSQRATLSEDFSLNLEDRLMKACEIRKTKRKAWLAMAVGAVCALTTGAGASYAATDGFTSWPWSVFIEEDGTVTSGDGETIGATVENEDGSFTTTIQMGEGSISLTPISKIVMGSDGEPVETPVIADDLKGKTLHLEIAP